jgi:endoglucanase
MSGGGTDGGRMHIFGAGVPSLVIGVPVRYIHTHASIMHLDDFTQAVDLLVAVIKRLDAEMVEQLRSA